MAHLDPFESAAELTSSAHAYRYHRLAALEQAGLTTLARLPYSIRILLESALRNLDGSMFEAGHVHSLATWRPGSGGEAEVPFLPGRVLLQDFTGVPCMVDLAAMRAAMQRLGGDPDKINPFLPCDLVIDHSVQVDFFGTPQARAKNEELEFTRNRERYEFLKWGQKSFANTRVVPPDTGIVHQVNLEYLAGCVLSRERDGAVEVFFDSLVGTDSHTTMINGLGVLGWGVGGIEAEAVMLGQPIYMLMPEVVGFELEGQLPAGTTATDLVLTITQILRQHGVVGKFVEFFGSGVAAMPLPDRATVANMAPEYGATMGFFPVDEQTLAYLTQTGRSPEQVALVEDYHRAQGLFRTADAPVPEFSDVLRLDCSTVQPSCAGPKRPQDLLPLSSMQEEWQAGLRRPPEERGFGLSTEALERSVALQGSPHMLTHGAVVIAAITSCTNTSNPSVLIAAGLLARKALAKGLQVKPWVKTSLAPGSRVVSDYLEQAGLDRDLAALGFETVAYGCTTCIGNSGPLPEPVAAAVRSGDLVAAAVLSGNRNFEGRINADVKANYLASPPLVIAYALAGTIDINLAADPIGVDQHGQDVRLADLWPSASQVREVIADCVKPEMFQSRYGRAIAGTKAWQEIETDTGNLYRFREGSTYITEPPFFTSMSKKTSPITPVSNARVLVMVGDSVTTDHISPAGAIAKDSPAGVFLQELGVEPGDFNSYGSRRGNDAVMTRGTFANIRLRNHLAPGTEGGFTSFPPGGETMTIYQAACRYREADTPLMVLAGKEYGTGSSRDWAAKGTLLLGIKMVLAESFERIHRSNLVGMGVLPLQYLPGQDRESLGLTGKEIFSLALQDDLQPRSRLEMTAHLEDSDATKSFEVLCRIDTPVEIEYFRNGGILQTVIRKLL